MARRSTGTDQESVRKKIVVVGDGFCGKTSMLFAFSKDEFPETYIPTICETFVKEVEVDDRPVQLVLWDTAGQEDYDRLRPLSYSRSHAVLVCFAVDDRTSFENVRLKWCTEVRHFCPEVPLILVATKLDLRHEVVMECRAKGKANTSVSAIDGYRLAEEVGASAYVECSAKTREGIRKVFEVAAKEVLRVETTVKKKANACEIC